MYDLTRYFQKFSNILWNSAEIKKKLRRSFELSTRRPLTVSAAVVTIWFGRLRQT